MLKKSLSQNGNRDPNARATREGPLWRAGLHRVRLRSRGPVILAPGEHIRTLTVDLPVRSAAKRRAAARFAVEEALAAPLDGVGITLGDSMERDRYIVAVADRERLAGWRAAMTEAGLRGARLVPDYLMLPVPPDAQTWTVWRKGERVLVRRSDHTGFAADPRTFALAWQAGGELALLASGDDLDDVNGAKVVRRDRHGRPDTRFAGLDLAPSDDARAEGAEAWGWARAAAVAVALGALAHGAMGVVELRALETTERERRADLDQLLSEVAPEGVTADEAVRRLQQAGPSGARAGFLETLARASAALAGLEDSVSIASLAYDDASGALDLDLVLTDLPALQRAEAVLAGAGLSPEPGTATSTDGATEARMRVRAAGRDQ